MGRCAGDNRRAVIPPSAVAPGATAEVNGSFNNTGFTAVNVTRSVVAEQSLGPPQAGQLHTPTVADAKQQKTAPPPSRPASDGLPVVTQALDKVGGLSSCDVSRWLECR